VTSGKNGKILVPLIHEEPAIIGIAIFCEHPEYHKDGHRNSKKLQKCKCEEKFNEVITNLKYYFHHYLCSYLFSALDLKG